MFHVEQGQEMRNIHILKNPSKWLDMAILARGRQ